MTYNERYDEGSRSREMSNLISARGEDPTYAGADEAGNELFQFSDGTDVIVTNAGVMTEDADGFSHARKVILDPNG